MAVKRRGKGKGSIKRIAKEMAEKTKALKFADMPYLEEPRKMDKEFQFRVHRSLAVPVRTF
jgi:hypothetical protein